MRRGERSRERAPGRTEAPDAYDRAVADAVDRALAEDLGPEGDLTAALVPAGVTAHFALRARQTGVVAGRDCATEAFRRVDPALDARAGTSADGTRCRRVTRSWRSRGRCGRSSPPSARR